MQYVTWNRKDGICTMRYATRNVNMVYVWYAMWNMQFSKFSAIANAHSKLFKKLDVWRFHMKGQLDFSYAGQEDTLGLSPITHEVSHLLHMRSLTYYTLRLSPITHCIFSSITECVSNRILFVWYVTENITCYVSHLQGGKDS